MKKRTPEIKFPGKFDPQIRVLIVYFVTTLVVLWVWQEFFRQVAVVTMPYSEFKAYVARHEVAEATIEQDEIVGRIVPKPAPEDEDGSPATESGQSRMGPRPLPSPAPSPVEKPSHFSFGPSGSRTRTWSTSYRRRE